MTATLKTALSVARNNSRARKNTWIVISDPDPQFIGHLNLGYDVREIKTDQSEYVPNRVCAAFHNGRRIS